MIYLYAFLFTGIVCLIGQVILDNTNLTPGHVNTMLVIIAVILEMLGVYSWCIKTFQAGASVLITNFGYLLYNSAYEGFVSEGIIGLFTGVLKTSSAGISYTIFIAFIISLIFKPKH